MVADRVERGVKPKQLEALSDGLAARSTRRDVVQRVDDSRSAESPSSLRGRQAALHEHKRHALRPIPPRAAFGGEGHLEPELSSASLVFFTKLSECLLRE